MYIHLFGAFFLLTTFASARENAPRLLKILNGNTQNISECQREDVITCQLVEVDFEALLGSEKLTFPNGAVLELSGTLPGTSEGSVFFSYMDLTNYSTVSLTYDVVNGSQVLEGEMDIRELHYELDHCGGECHVLIQKEVDDRPIDGESGVVGENGEDAEDRQIVGSRMDSELQRYVNIALDNPTSCFTVNVYMYYTSEFRARLSDPIAFINMRVNQMNQALALNRAYVRIRAFCYEEVGVSETSSISQLFYYLATFKGSVVAALGTADLAFLWTNRYRNGASGSASVINYPRFRLRSLPFAWGSLYRQHILQHELGHLFGARHNREQDPRDFPDQNFIHGWLVRGTRYRSIMAYGTSTYNTRLNVFSSPRLAVNGARLGTSRDDNGRLMHEMRYAMASIGIENQSCGSRFQCRDANANCAAWASRGYCTRTYSIYVRARCPRSCRLCNA